MFKFLLYFTQKLRFYYRKCCCKYRLRAEAVIIRKNPATNQLEVLLVERLRRSNKEWKFPGGGIEKGETPEIAAARESVNSEKYQILFNFIA